MENNISLSFWDRVFGGQLEHNRFGIISVALIVVACIGGIAQIYGVADNVFQMSLIVFPMMFLLSMILAVQSLRLILNLSLLCIAIDLIIILFRVIA